MATVTYTELRANLSRYMDEAVDGRAAITVTRSAGQGNVVLVSEDEYEGWQETVHLLRSPANARRLLRSLRNADAGQTTERELVPAKSPVDA